MMNLGLEIVFWLILLIYIGARLSQTKKVISNNIKKFLKAKVEESSKWSIKVKNRIKI